MPIRPTLRAGGERIELPLDDRARPRSTERQQHAAQERGIPESHGKKATRPCIAEKPCPRQAPPVGAAERTRRRRRRLCRTRGAPPPNEPRSDLRQRRPPRFGVPPSGG